jgi:hypothetical protein
MRREQYAQNKDKINAQKRAAYEQRTGGISNNITVTKQSAYVR